MTAFAATASPLRRRYSLEEFFALDEPQGGGYSELIAGVLYMVPPPSGPHHVAASRLNRILSRYADAHPERCTLFVPRTPIWIPADTYLEPDLFLVRTERLRETDAGRLTTADLVVEVISPGSAMYDRTAKADTYAALGVAELWLVDLESRTIEQRVLSGQAWSLRGKFSGTQAVLSETFPGLEVIPQVVFADAT
jgi:Uma2 family endonuclease